MIKVFRVFILVTVLWMPISGNSQSQGSVSEGEWITASQNQGASNTWMQFYKEFELDHLPSDRAIANIAVDSKYWLWVNGQMVVYEGGLKRGPNPVDSYFDQVDITPYLSVGKNSVSILVWYFGKNGFSHNSSGMGALFFECKLRELNLVSDQTWMSKVLTAYENTSGPNPNFRLPESNVRFNARLEDFDRLNAGLKLRGMNRSTTLGKPPGAPWNHLVKRPIPLWKDYGLKEYVNHSEIPDISRGDTLICRLPYNCHISPYLEIEAPAGLCIEIRSDAYNAFNGGTHPSVRAEYVTREGLQKYESYGWINGNEIRYFIPEGVKIKSLKYRETGYNCEFTGYFHCNDPFYNRLWEKSVRTLYVTMRDTYMDCPDRERAQWWGDMVNESGEAFYALSPEASELTRKGILELINWQRSDSTLFSPVPAGNYFKELPGQMLASVGYYGFWNYFLNTGDSATIREVYPGVRKYMHIWEINPNGTVKLRKGEWPWGDWGTDKDLEFLYNAWYSIALKGFIRMAELFEIPEDVSWALGRQEVIKAAVNTNYWTRDHYRSTNYKDDIDDRSQAMAVLAGYADAAKYPQILQVLKEQEYASPYMEKYVIEALFVMGYPEFGLERLKKRFGEMVDHPFYTTLWEGWEIGSSTFGGGTFNHAWSGGGLTILSQYVAGISPLKPGFKLFEVKPRMAGLTQVSAGNVTVAGEIAVSLLEENERFELKLEVPPASACMVYIPDAYQKISCNGKLIFNGVPKESMHVYMGNIDGYQCFKTAGGSFDFSASK